MKYPDIPHIHLIHIYFLLYLMHIYYLYIHHKLILNLFHYNDSYYNKEFHQSKKDIDLLYS